MKNGAAVICFKGVKNKTVKPVRYTHTTLDLRTRNTYAKKHENRSRRLFGRNREVGRHTDR